MITRKKKIAIAVLAFAPQIIGPAPGVHARDYGQYNDVPQHIRDWFKGLKNFFNPQSADMILVAFELKNLVHGLSRT